MAYYKAVADGYITGIGEVAKVSEGAIEISKMSFDEILSILHNKPPATETADYRLREDLTWEAYPIDPPDPNPDIDDAEAFEFLFGGAE